MIRKNLLLIAAIAFSSIVHAQQKGDFSGYVGVSYQLIDNADSGINAGVEYLILDNTAIAPSFSYYFSPKGITTYSYNADMRYYLNFNSRLQYYGLGGFSYLTVKTTVLGQTVKKENFGVNAGGGVVVSLNEKLGILAQLKYDSSGANSSIEPMLGITFKF